MNIPSDFYITDNRGLKRVVNLISKARIVAMDTEFTRERTYYPILSLIQIAVRDGDEKKLFIIDCLCDINLKPLYKIISDKKITKILHSSLQDLQIFHRQSKKLPEAISDTQIMANFCDIGFNIGYSGLVEHFFQKQIDKSQQRSNWQKRPLSEKQIEYALSDVLYLEEIHKKMSEMLEEKGRCNWYLEETKLFVKHQIVKSGENLFKNLNFRKKTAEEILKMQKLTLWREEQVKKMDIPRQHLIKDEAIEKVVTLNDVNIRMDPVRLKQMQKILDRRESSREVKKALDFARKNPYMSAQQKKIFEKAKIIIANVASQENLQEQFLITGPDLKSLIHRHTTVEELLSDWKFELFGNKLKQLNL